MSEAKNIVQVERGRVWIKVGGQSFMLAYEADTCEELAWYAKQLSDALASLTPDVKVQQAQAPERLALDMLCGLAGEVSTDDPMTAAERIFDHVQAERAAHAQELENYRRNLEGRDALISILRASMQQAQEPGMKLVPEEPTPEMRKAAADAWLDCDSRLCLNKAASAVRAGIKAAPLQGAKP